MRLTSAGDSPAVIYGRIGKEQLEPILIQFDLHDASLIIKKLTGSSLVTIDVEGEKYPAIIRKFKDIIYGTLRHVDFMAVSLMRNFKLQFQSNWLVNHLLRSIWQLLSSPAFPSLNRMSPTGSA